LWQFIGSDYRLVDAGQIRGELRRKHWAQLPRLVATRIVHVAVGGTDCISSQVNVLRNAFFAFAIATCLGRVYVRTSFGRFHMI